MNVMLLLSDGSLQTFTSIDNIGFLDRSHTIRSTGERTLIVNPQAVAALITDEQEVAE